jgi:hypothetical protein
MNLRSPKLIFTSLALTSLFGCSGKVIRPSIDEVDLVPISAEIMINADIQSVWSAVGAGFDQISRYSYDVEKSYFDTETDEKIGSLRTSEMRNGKQLVVAITRWEEERLIEWEIVKPHVPILLAGISSYTLTAEGDQTKLRLDGGFKTRFFVPSVIAKFKFKGVIVSDLSGIKHLVESGEEVNEKNTKEIIGKYEDQVKFL